MQEKLIHCTHTMVCTHVLHTPHHLPLDQVPGLLCCEVEDVQTIHIAGVEYVADNHNNRVQVFTSNGGSLRQFGKKGSGRGELSLPIGICVDSDG